MYNFPTITTDFGLGFGQGAPDACGRYNTAWDVKCESLQNNKIMCASCPTSCTWTMSVAESCDCANAADTTAASDQDTCEAIACGDGSNGVWTPEQGTCGPGTSEWCTDGDDQIVWLNADHPNVCWYEYPACRNPEACNYNAYSEFDCNAGIPALQSNSEYAL